MPKFRFAVNWKSKLAMKFDIKQYAIQKSAKNKPKKQENFNQNKPKKQATWKSSKQMQIHKKTSPILRENCKMKVGNTGVWLSLPI